jgi:outer membrane protein assembly factor BamB
VEEAHLRCVRRQRSSIRCQHVAADSPSYSSPVVAEFAGVRQVVVVGYRSIAGLSLDTGALLWQQAYGGLKYPHSLTPVVYRDTIVMSGSMKGLTSLHVSRVGDDWTVRQAWHNDSVSMSLSTPVVHGDDAFGLSDRNRGQFVCLDVRTGEIAWTSDGREGEIAAVLRAGSHILFLKGEGELVIANAEPRSFEVVARYTLADALTWGTPAIAAGELILKHGEELTAWRVRSHP